jgi:hypothetical protein
MGWVVFGVWVVVATAVASWIGFSVKGRPLTGFLLGIFLGWLGVAIISLLPRTAEKKVEKAMSERAIREEAERRYVRGPQGYQSWSGPPAPQPQGPVQPWASAETQQFPAAPSPPPYPQQPTVIP